MTPDYKLAARPGKCKKSDGSKIKNRAECEKACSILYASFKVGKITWYQTRQKEVGCLVDKAKGGCQWANFNGGARHRRGPFRAVCKAAAPTAWCHPCSSHRRWCHPDSRLVVFNGTKKLALILCFSTFTEWCTNWNTKLQRQILVVLPIIYVLIDISLIWLLVDMYWEWHKISMLLCSCQLLSQDGNMHSFKLFLKQYII